MDKYTGGMDIHRFTLFLAEFTQEEFGLGWAMTAALIFLGLLGVCAPRVRNKWPKEMREMKEREAARDKQRASKKSKSAKKKKKRK